MKDGFGCVVKLRTEALVGLCAPSRCVRAVAHLHCDLDCEEAWWHAIS